MSDWLVHLVRIPKLGNHPNANKLQLCQIYGQTVICQKDLYREGDLAVYLPIDSVLPSDPNHPVVKDSGLNPGHCIEAKRLRGIFSNGMLIPANVCFTLAELAELSTGTHVAEMLGIKKWEDEGDKLATQTENEKDLGYMPKYTDIEGWAKFRNEGIINSGDEVVLTEKLHGANSRFCFRDNRLWVGSHHSIKKEYVMSNQFGEQTEKSLWWAVAKEIKLEEKFRNLINLQNKDYSKTVLYGEVFGQVQNLNYGIEKGAKFRIFDTYDHSIGKYNDWDTTVEIANIMGLDLVPELYRGPWKQELEELRNGPSVLYPGHTREGFVMKPLKERFHILVERVVFKYIGEDYKLCKNKKKK